jgi:hypothetical protein
LAAIPAKDFDWYLQTAAEQELEIITRLLLYHSERREAAVNNQKRIVGGRIDDLIEFAAAGNRMGCIVVDPPWLILGSTLPYEAIEMDELRASVQQAGFSIPAEATARSTIISRYPLLVRDTGRSRLPCMQ